MPIRPIIAPCSGIPGQVPCKSLDSSHAECCVCRKSRAAGLTAVYATGVADTPTGFGPDCSRLLARLPANTTVGYTGTKLLAYTSAESRCTSPADYAQVMVQVRL